jgi:hypothetical protein
VLFQACGTPPGKKARRGRRAALDDQHRSAVDDIGSGYGPDHPVKAKVMISTSGSGQMMPLPMNEIRSPRQKGLMSGRCAVQELKVR